MKKKEKSSETEKKLERCEKEREEYLSGWKRARADLINYKKEEKDRMERFLKFSLEGFILKILPLLDDMERAENSLPEEARDEKGVRGLIQIKKKLESLLEKEGVEKVEVTGEEFDPRLAEAVEEVEKEGVEPGTVVEEVEKGYRMHDRIIRPAKVIVSKEKD